MQVGQEQVHSTTTVPPDLGDRAAEAHRYAMRQPVVWNPKSRERPVLEESPFTCEGVEYNMNHYTNSKPQWFLHLHGFCVTVDKDLDPLAAEVALVQAMRDRLALALGGLDSLLAAMGGGK